MRRITQTSSYSTRSNTCGSKTRLRISGTKSICLNRSNCEPLFLEERSCSFPVNEGVFRNAASRHFSHPFQRARLLHFGIEALKRLPDHYVGGDPRATKDF